MECAGEVLCVNRQLFLYTSHGNSLYNLSGQKQINDDNGENGKSGYPEWFGEHVGELNVVATYNHIYNAALMVEEGLGYAIGLDRTINATAHSALCFRPLTPKVESEVVIVWKKYQIFSAAAELFLSRLQETFTDSGSGN